MPYRRAASPQAGYCVRSFLSAIIAISALSFCALDTALLNRTKTCSFSSFDNCRNAMSFSSKGGKAAAASRQSIIVLLVSIHSSERFIVRIKYYYSIIPVPDQPDKAIPNKESVHHRRLIPPKL